MGNVGITLARLSMHYDRPGGIPEPASIIVTHIYLLVLGVSTVHMWTPTPTIVLATIGMIGCRGFGTSEWKT